MINLFVTWDIDPVLFTIFGFEIRYYSLAWMIAFILGTMLMGRMMKREWGNDKLLDSMFMYYLIGTIVGARLGHCLFYDPEYYLTHPFQILNLREGGLASHGGTIGLIVAMWLFGRKNKVPFLWGIDRIGIAAPLVGGLIRIGNLFNSEIFGTETSMPWGFLFVRSGEWQREFAPAACHPTQIYEAILYFVIFAILIFLYYKTNIATQKPGAMIGLSLTMIFTGRILIEMIKNVQETFEASMVLNMGQILSIPFVVIGVVAFILA
ncbi:MAG: prolipoprotein diacylglyceryl transferase, partial [Rikenellaceae bacterium]